MWVRKRIDITCRDIAFGVVHCCTARDRRGIRRQIGQCWSARSEWAADDVLVCLSVRSGFDLLLRALRLPPKSEVLISAANIADMTRIVEHHDLLPVPVELDAARMAPTVEHLRRAVTPATRAILVAHLFGSRTPLDPILEVAKEHQLLVFEDCAQAFDDTGYRGHPESDVVMFSFGTVKTATALGGGILAVRDRELLEKMQAQQEQYPVQGRWTYQLRLMKYALLAGASSRPVFGAAMGICRLLGLNCNRLIGNAVRGFLGPDFFRRVRRQPSAPLLALLKRRLLTLDSKHLAERAARGALLAELLRTHVECPAADVVPHNFWAFPIVVDDPVQVMAALAKAGFDSTQGHNLCAGTAPAGRPELDPAIARDALSRMIYLPCYAEMPNRAVQRMAEVLLQQCRHSADESLDAATNGGFRVQGSGLWGHGHPETLDPEP